MGGEAGFAEMDVVLKGKRRTWGEEKRLVRREEVSEKRRRRDLWRRVYLTTTRR
jgi:hypothetical protein